MKQIELRLQVYRRFEKALKKKGYLSLHSIIESNFDFPRKSIIDPVRRSKIKKIYIIKKERVLSEQQLFIANYKREKLGKKQERLVKLKKT